jgi:hypothetical protein
MNERINGLWWKARIGYNNQNCDPEVLEKFAELIVRECADLFEVEWGDEKLTGNDVGYVVKKHFGVEE